MANTVAAHDRGRPAARLAALFFSALWILTARGEPAAVDALIAEAGQLQLAGHPTWRGLLHVEPGTRQSKVTSADFFLAPDGRSNPEQELAASLAAFFAPIGGKPDEHAQCRFPARFRWLGTQLPALNAAPAAACARLDSWARLAALESVSMVMVSGYFGNPASSFGHLLLKLNNGANPPGLSLLDLGINYGALVPDGEATPVYVLRGLFGGYAAGFSDKLYYTQDLAYSGVEFRDMWEYELELAPEERAFLAYHVWEMAGRKFDYLFLRENCAFRMAELLELVTGLDFTSGVDVWYAPVSLFHRLMAIDAGERRLIRGVRFQPSAQRVLYHEFTTLARAERAAVNRLIREPPKLEGDLLDRFAPDRQAALLDVLLAYYQYRLVATNDREAAAPSPLRARKDAVLRARLARAPGRATDLAAVPALWPPAEGSRPSRVGVGGGTNGKGNGFGLVTAAAFAWDGIGNNNLQGSELVVLEATAGYSADGGVYLDHVDVVRARKLNLNTARIAGEDQWSWKAGLGVRRSDLACDACTEAYGTLGAGRAAALGDAVTVYALLDGQLDSRDSRGWLRPNVGLRYAPNRRLAGQLEVAWEEAIGTADDRATWRLDGRYSLTPDLEIRWFGQRQEATELGVFIQTCW